MFSCFLSVTSDKSFTQNMSGAVFHRAEKSINTSATIVKSRTINHIILVISAPSFISLSLAHLECKPLHRFQFMRAIKTFRLRNCNINVTTL